MTKKKTTSAPTAEIEGEKYPCPDGFDPKRWALKTESMKATWLASFKASQEITKRGER